MNKLRIYVVLVMRLLKKRSRAVVEIRDLSPEITNEKIPTGYVMSRNHIYVE